MEEDMGPSTLKISGYYQVRAKPGGILWLLLSSIHGVLVSNGVDWNMLEQMASIEQA